jgi:putative transposase
VIQSLATRFPVRTLCRLLEVSPSGYYQWRQRQPGRRERANQELFQHIQHAWVQSRQTYGSPRITRCLQRQQLQCSENRVARLMHRHQLQARSKRPFRPKTTDSAHGGSRAPNRLQALGSPTRLNQVWVADITYIHTQNGWVYLAAVMDLHSRRILGWSVGCSLHGLLVRDALQHALALRRPTTGLIHHSDQGRQYASALFQNLLRSAHILPSMSSRGNCYDNAAMESFWSTLKTELLQNLTPLDLPQASQILHHYIEKFYNPKRLHSALGFLSPLEFERQLT